VSSVLELQEISDVLDSHSGLSRRVLEYGLVMKDLVDQAKQPGFTAESWAPLAEFVDTARFRRVGVAKEVMDWQTYVAFLTGWATTSEWEGSFKRVTEVGNLVFQELEERSRVGDSSSAVNTLSVFEFDADHKVVHLDVYIQMEMR
jgi:hypothetical protein